MREPGAQGGGHREKKINRPASSARNKTLSSSTLILLSLLCTLLIATIKEATAQVILHLDEWTIECDGAAYRHNLDCSATVVLPPPQPGFEGRFAIVIMIQTGDVGITGKPIPVHAIMRIGRSAQFECRGPKYCLFPRETSINLIKELSRQATVFVDIPADADILHFSLSTAGFQLGIAQLRAWGYPIPFN